MQTRYRDEAEVHRCNEARDVNDQTIVDEDIGLIIRENREGCGASDLATLQPADLVTVGSDGTTGGRAAGRIR